jgi:transketolase
MKIDKIKNFANDMRRNIIFTAYKAGSKSAHIGGALSVTDIIAVLYSDIMNIKKTKHIDQDRDRFILSKGHACLAIYSALVVKKILKKKDLLTFECDGSKLLGHPIINKKDGIEFSTGSLGMGLSLGVGVALAAKKRKKSYNTYVAIGDGECNEGSIWETILSACQFNLDNLTVIVDRNKYQQTGSSNSILNLENLKSKFESFGCFVLELDGHNLSKIHKAFIQKNLTNKPKVIIANTIKGKGFKIFENNNDWHHSAITKSIYKKIQKEI